MAPSASPRSSPLLSAKEDEFHECESPEQLKKVTDYVSKDAAHASEEDDDEKERNKQTIVVGLEEEEDQQQIIKQLRQVVEALNRQSKVTRIETFTDPAKIAMVEFTTETAKVGFLKKAKCRPNGRTARTCG